MKKALVWLLVIGTTGGTRFAKAACTPVPGAAQLWSNASLKWVWVGETHGSNESPAAFANLVCNALESGRRVGVALERPTTEQPALQAMLTSAKLPDAGKALLGQPDWQDSPDGRSSNAMLQLMLSLRALRKRYLTLQVYAVDGPSYTAARGSRDEAIGNSVLALKKEDPGALILVLTGNVHAMRAPLFGFPTSAMVLPESEFVSLEFTDRKGSQAWISTSAGCGPQTSGVADKDQARPYGIYLDPNLSPVGKVDGVFALGTPLTASSPAVGEVSPLPECRRIFLASHPVQLAKP